MLDKLLLSVKKTTWISLILTSLSFILGGIAWSLLAANDDSALIPPISHIYSSLIHYSFKDIPFSLMSLFPGLILGIFAGILLGLCTGRIRIINDLLSPLINFIRAMPPVSLVPVYVAVLGIGYVSKVVIIAMGVFFPVWISTHEGVQCLPSRLKYLCKDYNLNFYKKYKLVIIPHTTPYIISGIRIAIALSLVMLFISEWMASTEGIGYRMSLADTLGNMDDLISGVIILGFLSLIIDQSFVFITKRYLPWIGK